jgi:hypothetical protein
VAFRYKHVRLALMYNLALIAYAHANCEQIFEPPVLGFKQVKSIVRSDQKCHIWSSQYKQTQKLKCETENFALEADIWK